MSREGVQQQAPHSPDPLHRAFERTFRDTRGPTVRATALLSTQAALSPRDEFLERMHESQDPPCAAPQTHTMHKFARFAVPSFLRTSKALGLCLAVGLGSPGCDKGEDKKQDADSDGKQDSEGKSETDGDDKDDATNEDKPADNTGLTKDQIARTLKLCKETCEDKSVLECEEIGFDDTQDKCIEDCEETVGFYFGASTDEECLDSLEDTFSCLFGVDCEDFPAMSEQLIGLLSKDTKFSGGCADQYAKSAEHCSEDLKKAMGSDLDDDPNKPAPAEIYIVMKGSEWMDTKATITENDKGVHKVVISNNSELDCGDDESTLDSVVTLSLEASASATTSVHFHHDKQSTVVEQANVSLAAPKDGKRIVTTQAIHKDGLFSVVGSIAAKICE